MRYVVEPSVVLHLLEQDIEPGAELELLAPTLARSEVLDALYRAVRRGDLTPAQGKERLARFATMKIRYLGDKVLRSQAWKVAEQLDWESTHRAEYIALTQLQADRLVTMDDGLAATAVGLVALATIDDLVDPSPGA